MIGEPKSDDVVLNGKVDVQVIADDRIDIACQLPDSERVYRIPVGVIVSRLVASRLFEAARKVDGNGEALVLEVLKMELAKQLRGIHPASRTEQ